MDERLAVGQHQSPRTGGGPLHKALPRLPVTVGGEAASGGMAGGAALGLVAAYS